MHNVLLNIIENQLNGIIILNKDLEIIYTNKSAENLLSDELNNLLSKHLKGKYKFIKDSNWEKILKEDVLYEEVNSQIKVKKEIRVNNEKLKKGEEEIILSFKIVLYENDYILIEIVNIDVLTDKMFLLTKLIDKSKDFMFFKDKNLRYIYLNEMYSKFFEKNKEDIIGKTDKDLLNENLLGENLYSQCYKGDLECLRKGHYYDLERIGERYFRVSKEKIDEGILCIARDITEEMAAVKNLEIDKLTGLYNRYKLENVVDTLYLNKEKDYYFALIDLDDLREINNTYGHLKGDIYLKALGNILKNQKESMFFRIGGDEFASVIDCRIIDPNKLFENIFDEIEKLNMYPKLSISAGINKFNINEKFEDIFEKADKALYEAKEAGKNKYIIKYI